MPYKKCQHIFLKIVIGIRQIGLHNQEFTGFHLMELSGSVVSIYAWFLPGLIGACILGFPLSLRKHEYEFRHNSSVFTLNSSQMNKKQTFQMVWSFGICFCALSRIGDVITYIKPLAKFTQQALNCSNQATDLLNSELSIMRKAVLWNQMAFYISPVCQKSPTP